MEGPSKRESRGIAQEETLYAECEQTDPVEDSGAPISTSVEELISSAKNSGLVQMTGRTPCDRIVVFNGTRDLAGTFQRVKIVEAAPFTLFGTLVEQ